MPAFANGEKGTASLEASMRRVGARMSAREFIQIVSNTYHAIEAENYVRVRHALFPRSGSYNDLKSALIQCKHHLPGPITVLNIGCGAGYEAGVLREIFESGDVRRIVLTDISPDMVRNAETRLAALYRDIEFQIGSIEDLEVGVFDLVITHSLVHHIADLPKFFKAVSRVTAPGQDYLMAHEPSSRFYRNPECLRVYNEVQTSEERRKMLMKWVDPRRWIGKLRRMIQPSETDRGLYRKINDRLRANYEFTGELTSREIAKLVDIHSPCNLPGDFSIGFDGFDWEKLHRSFLEEFELVQAWTSDYMGGTNPSRLSMRWQQVNDALAEKYPLDGSNFTVLWRKRAAK